MAPALRDRGRCLVGFSHTGLYSGAEIVLERVLVRARAAGWSVSCCVPLGPFAEKLRLAGISGPTLPDLKLAGGPRALAIALAAGRAAAAAGVLRRAARDADLVLVNGLLALPAVRLARLPLPVAWLVHDMIWRRDAKALLRLCAPAVTLAVPVSNVVAGPVEAAGVRARVVHNGTPWPVDPATADTPGPPVIGCNALLTPWKGQNVLLDAVGLASHRDVEVELLGGAFPKDSGYVASLHVRADQPDLAGRVRFVGRSSDVFAVMRRWICAVSASVEPEAGPLSALEAMSFGLPVVATAHGGAPEVLGGAGVLVPPGDAGALARAIDTLLDDDALRQRKGREGRARVAAHFRLDAKLDELLSVLATLAAGPQDPAATSASAPLRPRLRAAAASAGVLVGRPGAVPGAVVLAYHDVREGGATDGCTVSPAQLRRQLGAAQRAGVHFVDLATLTRMFLAGHNIDGLGAVAFDDGLVGVHRHGLHVLEDLGIPATVFVVTDVVGETPPWWAGAERTMTRAELEELSGAGVRIAAHSRTHPSLPGLSPATLRAEVEDPRKLLEDVAQAPVELFAYPFGDHDAPARAAVADAGYHAAYTFLNGRVVPGLDRLRLPRLTMGPHHGMARLAYHLSRAADAWPDTQIERVP